MDDSTAIKLIGEAQTLTVAIPFITTMDKQKRMPFPYTIQELKPEKRAEVARLFKSPFMDFVSVGPKGYKLTRSYTAEAENIYNMPLRCDDIFVVSYPRSGTTWTQELVWLLGNNLDYTKAANELLPQRFPYLDVFQFLNMEFKEDFFKNLTDAKFKDPQFRLKVIKGLELLATPLTDKLGNVPSARFIKTHLPLSLLPPSLLDTAKVVYVARDPRDVAVSTYHLSKFLKFMDFIGTFQEFWNLFINNMMLLAPYFEHIKEAWEQRHHPNMLFLFYEELSKDLKGTAQRVAKFLGKTPSTEQLEQLCKYLHIDNFKRNTAVNNEFWRESGLFSPDKNFIRKGKVGGWRDYFDEEMSMQAERWIAENLRDTDLRFSHSDN